MGHEMTPTDGSIPNWSGLDIMTFENIANGWPRDLEVQLEECPSDFAVTPAGVLLGELENETFNFRAGCWPSTLVFLGIGPFPANQITMPTKDGFGLEDADDRAKLICGLLGYTFQLSGQNSQGQLLNPTGSDGVIEFAL